jgi:type II secretion system protein G
MTKRVTGFTLIELLVVIVIIGILATLATVTLSSARSKARDARRVSDVKQIQTALELWYNDVGSYPTTSGAPAGSYPTANSAFFNGNTTYMAKVPGNPSPYNDGTCLSTGAGIDIYPYAQDSATTYHIIYCLGGTTGAVAAGSHMATPGTLQNP